MNRRIIRIIVALMLIITLVSGISIIANAEVPCDSYTYWADVDIEDKAVPNREMYATDTLITSKSLGVSDFSEIKDICTDKSGRLYILDNNSRITVTDDNYNLLYEITNVNGNINFNEAEGVYVERDGTIFICDTKNHRLLHITSTGELIKEIGVPDSPLIPDDFNYQPTAMATDESGYVYVLSEGSFYGALLYSPELDFLGFYGANSVKGSLSSILNNIKNKLFSNNEKKSKSSRNLPYCFTDITIDNNGFVYTCNGYTSKYGNSGQIRRLSPGTGSNILASDGINFVDTKTNETYENGALSRQDITSIEVDSQGFIFALESAYGKIFVYDKNGNTLSVFGGGTGTGSQMGSFVSVCALALGNDGERIYVADKRTNYVTVFEATEFGRLVRSATALTVDGKYDQAKELWLSVNSLDNNYQPAYSGLARVCISEENYSEAMRMAKIGYDRDSYAIAYEYERNQFLNDNFLLIFILVIILVAVLILLLIIKSKKKFTIIKNKDIRTMFGVLIHPANVFTDIKEKKLGSFTLCIVTVLIFYVSTVLQTLAGGFMFSIYDSSTFNSLWVFVRSVGLVVLWISADWLVCTLLGGNGKLKEITVVTCYSLWPLIFSNFIILILTNVLLPNESSFLSILKTVAILYFLLLMVIGLLKIHDFTMTRLVGTSALAIVGIMAIIFLMILVIILVQQFCGFIVTVASEISTL